MRAHQKRCVQNAVQIGSVYMRIRQCWYQSRRTRQDGQTGYSKQSGSITRCESWHPGRRLMAAVGFLTKTNVLRRGLELLLLVTRLVMVNILSADPCNQSQSARETPYSSLAAMAAGMVNTTKSKQVAKPTTTPLGHRCSELAPSKPPASFFTSLLDNKLVALLCYPAG